MPHTISTKTGYFMYRWSSKQDISAPNDHHRYMILHFYVPMVSAELQIVAGKDILSYGI